MSAVQRRVELKQQARVCVLARSYLRDATCFDASPEQLIQRRSTCRDPYHLLTFHQHIRA